MSYTRYTQQDLDEMLEKHREVAIVHCRLLRPIAGGLPLDEDGLKAFVQYHLGLEPGTEEFEAAFKRISSEEVDTTPEGGELQTEEVYGVKGLRKRSGKPFILEHQIKALIKQAASRMGLFVEKRGSKGDIAELGTIEADGPSRVEKNRPWEIYLFTHTRGAQPMPAGTQFIVINGKVQTPQGAKSIQSHTEISDENAQFMFKIMWPAKKIKQEDMALILAAATKIGIGSCLSLGYGRFEVVDLQFGKS